jgi:putative sterol carrier protein
MSAEQEADMPVQFLSPEWTEELEKRLNASDAFRAAAAAANVTIQNVIDTPDGAKRYWMRFEGGSVKLEAGDAEKADATIEQDYDTAVALAKSELNPVSAFMTGKIRINGSMMLLMQLQGALSELAKEMQEIDVDY